MEAVCYSSRSSACRRELNSHGAAKPRVPACPRQRAPVKNQGIPVRQLGDLIPCPSMSSNDMEPPQYVVPAHRVGGPGVRSVRQAVITGAAASRHRLLRWREQCQVRHRLQRGAGGNGCASRERQCPCSPCVAGSPKAALPNPSFNLSTNSRPLGPARAVAYPAPAGPSGLLLAPG